MFSQLTAVWAKRLRKNRRRRSRTVTRRLPGLHLLRKTHRKKRT
jgi:hypothetical protein